MARYNDPRILPSLPSVKDVDGVSVLSWNVLLPNSQDGWWVYKYYGSEVPREQTAWPAREALFRGYFAQADADIVCIQEASGDSFAADFAFMKELGYDCELHRKFRFRSATFWKRSKLQLVEAFHKDRVLITCLADVDSTGGGADADTKSRMFVVNCHLSGGSDPKRRFGQVEQALDQVRKGVNKHRKAAGQAPADDEEYRSVPVIVCGDFNSEAAEKGAETAWRALLSKGAVHEDFREAAYPDSQVASKTKTQPFGEFADTYADAYRQQMDRGAPATYIAASLDPKFLTNGFEQRRAGGDLEMTPELLSALERMFVRFAGAPAGASAEGLQMDRAAVDEWLVTINGELGRGSEFRTAMELLDCKDDSAGGEPGRSLTFANLVEVYKRELREGKYWGVQHDLGVCGVDFQPPPERTAVPYQGTLDGIHANRGAWALVAVVEPLPSDRRADVYEGGDFPPNSWCPSDHLPVAAVLRRCG